MTSACEARSPGFVIQQCWRRPNYVNFCGTMTSSGTGRPGERRLRRVCTKPRDLKSPPTQRMLALLRAGSQTAIAGVLMTGSYGPHSVLHIDCLHEYLEDCLYGQGGYWYRCRQHGNQDGLS